MNKNQIENNHRSNQCINDGIRTIIDVNANVDAEKPRQALRTRSNAQNVDDQYVKENVNQKVKGNKQYVTHVKKKKKDG